MSQKNQIKSTSVKNEAMSTTVLQDGLDKLFKSGYSLIDLNHAEVQKLGLPLTACTGNHYIKAHLFVTDSGTVTGLPAHRIGQTLVFTPCNDGNTEIYTRTGEISDENTEWGKWEKLATATELAQALEQFKPTGAEAVEWGVDSCINTFVEQGTYDITGERLNVADGLPIANAAPGHTFHARLVVLDSSITGTGKDSDKCITQILTLSNRTGGDGDIYVRTGRAASINALVGGNGWEPWGKLQQNVEVGQVTSLDDITSNGVYSGVYTNGSTMFETFVMVVINNYAVAGATGNIRSISQFKYALGTDGTFSYKTRTGQGNTGVAWGNWVDIGAATTADIQDNSITAQKLSTDVLEQINSFAICAEHLKAFDPQQTLLCSNYLYTNTGIENALTRIYYLLEQDNETIKGAFLTGMIVNVLGTGTLSLYLAENVELDSRVETLVEEISVTQLGVQVIRFSKPIVVGLNQTFGFKMGFKHAVSTTYGAAGYMGVGYVYNGVITKSNKDFGFGLVGMKKYDVVADKYPVTRGILGSFLNRINPYYDHLFIDKTNGVDVTIPSESIYSVAISKRLGFDVLELNVNATSDGAFLVFHGNGGKFGSQFEHIDGVTDISGVAVNSVTLEWVKSNVRYKSKYPKYRTAPSTLEEMLYECKRNGIVPFVQRVDVKVNGSYISSITVVRRIMGDDNFISYGSGSARGNSAPIYYYGAESSLDAILAVCEKFGKPLIYGINGVTKFTDDELRNIVDTLHNKGYFVGFAGCYQDEPLNQKLLNMGFDMSGSGWNVPVFTDSNIVCADEFGQFTHNGTVNDGELILSAGNTVTIAHNGSVPFLSVGLLQIRFTGKLNIKMGDYINNEFVSDGDSAMTLTTYYLEKAPAFSITAVEGTTIKDILFKASKR